MNNVHSFAILFIAVTLACHPSNPENYHNCDWRTVGAVTPVRDQGSCAACWAFAAVAVVETYQFRMSGDYGELEVLSEQHLIDCAYKYNPEKIGRCFKKKGSICGGDPFEALNAIRSHMGGLYTNGTYPWRADKTLAQEKARGKCANHPGQQKYPTRLSQPSKAFFRREINEGIKGLIVENGPVVATIHFPKDWEQPDQPYIYTNPCTGTADHAVAVVGFGEENGQSFWILKNSHGLNWGDRGYIRLGMRPDNDDADCGFKRNIVYFK